MRKFGRRRTVAALAAWCLTFGPGGAAALAAGEAGTWNHVLYRMTLGASPLVGVSGIEASAVGFPPAPSEVLPARPELAVFDAPSWFEPLLERMWDASPTFRRQCTRLAQASARVHVALDLRGDGTSLAAKTEVERRGTLRAYVHLRPADANQPRHLAHEVEHLLEQLDGVDLGAAVADGVRGARPGQSIDAFETDRAIAVGRRMALEVERRGR